MSVILPPLPTEMWLAELSEANYEFIRRLVYEKSRIDLGPDKKALVASRLTKRLRALRMANYDSYCGLLKTKRGADEELSNLIDVISTNHTHFFRESRHFDFLRDTAIPQWRAKNQSALRIWSAACSSGEEPYTLAIVLAEALGLEADWRIMATDISTRMLATARAGVYSADRLSHVLPERRGRYFQKGVGSSEGQFRVKDELRRRVDFAQINLLQGNYPFHAKFDVILCRNVMIYFDRDTQETLVNKLAQHLHTGGYLMVGHSESLSAIRHGLAPLQPALYQKRAA
jgi:chemotaxis protein methyltransferase CheR